MIEKDKKNIIFEDYEKEFNYKKNQSSLNISFNRISFIFFVFFVTCFIYSLKILYLGSLKQKSDLNLIIQKNKSFRADIIDVNKNILSKSLNVSWAAINPKLITDEKKLLINLRLIFPNKDFEKIKKKIRLNKYFYIDKNLDDDKVQKLHFLGDKSIIFEEKISRIYPQTNLFSHVLGQIDDNNKGISGLEKYYDDDLKNKNKPLQLTLDSNIQFLIREELLKAQNIFKTVGSAALLMDINNGEIISLISLPDTNLNYRKTITDLNYTNKITKGVYELGSVFKSFTIAAALETKSIKPDTMYKDLPKTIFCSGKPISEYDDKMPKDLTVEEILVRSSNIGTVKIAREIGEKKMKDFYNLLQLLERTNFDLEEVGTPLPLSWGNCLLETSSYGHGITTTPLQLGAAYATLVNGGYKIKPTLIRKNKNYLKKEQLISRETSMHIRNILRKVVSTKEGTAEFADIEGYQIAGKTGTAEKAIEGKYSSDKKINTFVSFFPYKNPKHLLIVILDEPKPAPNYIYTFKHLNNYKSSGYKKNTAGWNSALIAGKIIEKIGPILATKYDVN